VVEGRIQLECWKITSLGSRLDATRKASERRTVNLVLCDEYSTMRSYMLD